MYQQSGTPGGGNRVSAYAPKGKYRQKKEESSSPQRLKRFAKISTTEYRKKKSNQCNKRQGENNRIIWDPRKFHAEYKGQIDVITDEQSRT